MKYKKENGVITLDTSDPSFLGIAVWTCIMAAPVLWLLFGQIIQTDLEPTDIFGICFLVFWLSVVSWQCRTALRFAGQILVISAEGVSIKTKFSLFKPIFLSWSEIADYGYVYMGNYAFKGEVKQKDAYVLYFAKNQLPIKKRLKRKKAEKGEIRFNFYDEGARNVTDYVLPFCQQYAQCKIWTAENNE